MYDEEKNTVQISVRNDGARAVDVRTDALRLRGGTPKEKILTKIEVYKEPLRTQFYIGETFDRSGMRVLAYYADGSAEIVTNWTYEPTAPLTEENDTVTVTYTEKDVTKTCTQTISVKPEPAKPVGIKVDTPPAKLEYTEGEKFDPAGMKVKLKMSDDSVGLEVTSDVTYQPFGALTTEDKEITLSYKYGEDTFTEKIAITVKEGVATIPFGGGTYQKAHDIVLGEDETAYELSEGLNLVSWNCNGTIANSPFKRAQSQKANQYVTFTLDFSGLTDKSEIGFSANMIIVRRLPLITVSTDGQTWEHIGFQNGTPKHRYNSDFNEKVTHLRGREVNDSNLHRLYWSLSDYADKIGPDGLLYVRFGFTDEYENTLAASGGNIGADVIDGVTYYEKLTFTTLDNRYTLTLGNGVKFVGGGKTATLRPGKPMPEVIFDDTNVNIADVQWSDGAGAAWGHSDFKMPERDVTLNYSNDKSTLTLGDGMTFVGGGKTAELGIGAALPEITFESGVNAERVYFLGDNGKVWKNGEFKMPSQDLTLTYVTVCNPYKGQNGYGTQMMTEAGQYLIGDGGYSHQPSGVSLPSSMGELTAMSDGKLAQLYKLPKMADNYTLRLQTTPRRDTNANYTYDIDYTFYNMSDKEITVTVYQINSGKETAGCKNGTVTLAAGESKTVNLQGVGFSGNNNFLTYLVFNGATADEFPIAIHSYFTPKPVTAA